MNLASYLSEQNKRVLLIDMDPQANATSGIGIHIANITGNVYDFLLNQAKYSDVIYPTPFENLHILPSTTDLVGAEIEMVPMVSRETILKDKIQDLREHFDFIIIDCPPSLGLLTVNALVASDRTIIPVQCEYFALEGLAKLVQTLNIIRDNYNSELSISGIVLTMFDKRTTLNRSVVQNARDYFKELVFDTVVPRNIRLTEAPSHGLPIALYRPTSTGSIAYLNLAKEVISRVATK
ncbi:MAG: ParA family protein [Candidatus Margulisbacteria bacterium]|nr:ParA family protein [Candidatus Margulisiibacteriota bacterium]